MYQYQILETETYTTWFASLKDKITKVRIGKRIDKIRHGNLGDVKNLGDGVSELRCQFGAGYRIYFTQKERMIIILLCAGDKSTQSKDIEKAKQIASEV
jgi:putative addiction module killer protein